MCEEENKDCIYCRCKICKDSLEMFKLSPEDSQTLIMYQQWQKPDKHAEKITISATVNDVFDDLKNQMNNFLVHRYIKRKQHDHFTNLIQECDGSSAVLQVDFQKMHPLSTRMRFNQPTGLISKSSLSPAMYGLTKMSRRALPLFLMI